MSFAEFWFEVLRVLMRKLYELSQNSWFNESCYWYYLIRYWVRACLGTRRQPLRILSAGPTDWIFSPEPVFIARINSIKTLTSKEWRPRDLNVCSTFFAVFVVASQAVENFFFNFVLIDLLRSFAGLCALRFHQHWHNTIVYLFFIVHL